MVFSLVVSILPTFVVAETNSSDNGANNVVAPEAENGQFSKGEVESERTSNTKTFYLGEGKFERKIFATPIHQKDEKSGKWKEVSPNLVDKNTSEVTTEETILTPSFLKKMDNGKYVTYKYADQTISFSLMKGKDTEGNEYKPNDVQAKYKHKENRIYYKFLLSILEI